MKPSEARGWTRARCRKEKGGQKQPRRSQIKRSFRIDSLESAYYSFAMSACGSKVELPPQDEREGDER